MILKTPEENRLEAKAFLQEEKERENKQYEERKERLLKIINKLVVEAISLGHNYVEIPAYAYTQLSALDLFPTIEKLGYKIVKEKTLKRILWVYPITTVHYTMYWKQL